MSLRSHDPSPAISLSVPTKAGECVIGQIFCTLKRLSSRLSSEYFSWNVKWKQGHTWSGVSDRLVMDLRSTLLLVGGSVCSFRLLNAVVRFQPATVQPARHKAWKWRNISTSLVHSLITGAGAVLWWVKSHSRKSCLYFIRVFLPLWSLSVSLSHHAVYTVTLRWWRTSPAFTPWPPTAS